LIGIEISLKELKEFIKRVIPALEGDYSFEKALNLFLAVPKNEGDSIKVNFTDFMIICIIFAKITLKQKLQLLFDLFEKIQPVYTEQTGINFANSS